MSATERLAWIAKVVPTLQGKGIVYTLTTKDAETVAEWLIRRGIRAHAYHGAITTADQESSDLARIHLEDAFTNGDLDVLVATSALGMGYDNPEVRFVIHYQTPGSIIAYYQQVGRAGRGKEGALGVLMSGPEDNDIQEYFRTSSLPSIEDVTSILAALSTQETMTSTQLMAAVNMGKGRLDQTLGYLAVQSPAPIARQGSAWRRNPVAFNPDYAKHRADLIAMRITEWTEINAYRTQDVGCRMNTLLTALDDPAPVERCGRCDRCLGHPVVDVTLPRDLLAEAATFLNRPLIHPIKPRAMIPKGSLPTYGFSGKIPANRRAEPGCVMIQWSDKEALRNMIWSGKRQGRFDDTVVDAAVTMIRDHWQPSPSPAWVTCVSSLRHPTLVPDFAERLADRLGLPFADIVRKTRETEPQKLQENSVHQSRNLDGVFEIAGTVTDGPVLLVDDMVDSGWTLSIVAMLLRQAGSGPVLPFALVSTTKSGQ
jgi:ATP-dependent DNA helicase RecQ